MPALWDDTFASDYFAAGAYTIVTDTEGHTVAPNLLTVATNGLLTWYDSRTPFQEAPFVIAAHVVNSDDAAGAEVGFSNVARTWIVVGVVTTGTTLTLGIESPSLTTTVAMDVSASSDYWITMGMNAQGLITVATTDNPTSLTYNAGSTFAINFQAAEINSYGLIESNSSRPATISEWKYGVQIADPNPIAAFASAQASETADTINKPKTNITPVVVDFTWAPTTPENIMVGTIEIPIQETLIGTPITFSAAVVLPTHRSVVNYEWKMGDGTIYQTGSPSVVHTYTVANFQARASLTITDDLGNTYSVGHQLYLSIPTYFAEGDLHYDGSVVESYVVTPPLEGLINYEGSMTEGYSPGPTTLPGVLYIAGGH